MIARVARQARGAALSMARPATRRLPPLAHVKTSLMPSVAHASTRRHSSTGQARESVSPGVTAAPPTRLARRSRAGTEPAAPSRAISATVVAPAKVTAVTRPSALFRRSPRRSPAVAGAIPAGTRRRRGCPPAPLRLRLPVGGAEQAPRAVSIRRCWPSPSPSLPSIRLLSPKKRATNSAAAAGSRLHAACRAAGCGRNS